IHTPTATLATMAAAASQRSGTPRRGVTVRDGVAAPSRRASCSRASICGHRSRPGSSDWGSSASELTRRRADSSVVMSVDLHTESLAQQCPRAVQLGLARAFGDAEHRGRLAVRITVEGVQYQGIARAVRQPRDRRLDLLDLDGRLEQPLAADVFAVVVRGRLD